MKRILLLCCLTLGWFTLHAQTYNYTTPEGFGAAATGGGSLTPVIVTNYTDLKSNLQSTDPKVILVSGTITLNSGQNISEVITNKTLIGLPGAKLVNLTQTQSGGGILNLKNGSDNVVIRNLIFEGPGAYDIDGRDNLTADGCTNLWVDHCEFQDGLDGNFDIKGNSDNVTVSWCKFTYLKPATSGGSGGSNDHRFSNLIGSSSSNAPADGHYSVTFQNCYWASGCKERMPRARNAELHIVNCYYNTDVNNAKALGLGGGINNLTCYVENTNFESVANVYTPYSGDGGTVSLAFTNCLNGVSNVGSVTAPGYTYTTFPVTDVATYVGDTSCGAGATLQVTNNGTITSTCDNLGIATTAKKLEASLYPTVVTNNITVKLESAFNSSVSIQIISSNGKEIKTQHFENPVNSEMNLNLNQLSKGTYFCKISTQDQVKTIRFIKK